MSKEFEEFLAKELKHLKKEHPEINIMKNIIIESEEPTADGWDDVVDELDEEIPTPKDQDDADVHDEAEEFE